MRWDRHRLDGRPVDAMAIGCLGVERRVERFFSYLAICTLRKCPIFGTFRVRASARTVATGGGNDTFGHGGRVPLTRLPATLLLLQRRASPLVRRLHRPLAVAAWGRAAVFP